MHREHAVKPAVRSDLCKNGIVCLIKHALHTMQGFMLAAQARPGRACDAFTGNTTHA